MPETCCGRARSLRASVCKFNAVKLQILIFFSSSNYFGSYMQSKLQRIMRMDDAELV